MKEKVKNGEDVSVEDVKEWLVEVKEIDKLLRDRLFVLTVAAELGWRVASDMASHKKGNSADKDLAKAVKKEEKRKREEKENKPKKKKNNFNQAFRQYHQPQQMYPAYNPALAAAVALPPPPPPPLYQRWVETRACLGCSQVGHLLRNCPRGGPSTSGTSQK